MPLQPGTTLGPYQIDAPLGAGGMGEVYKATDTRLDRTVAIKVLPEHVANDPDLKQRFEREAKTVAALNHPHICTLYDIGNQDGIDFLVMEYLDGQTLAQRLEKGALPLDLALTVAIEIADALDKAHRQGIVHRDLKPANIMLTKAGAKLLDFGLAKPSAVGTGADSALPTMSAGLTAKGAILGTLQYMAPEQLEGDDTDARTDIFAFGTTFYEMVTGERAFSGKSQASLIGSILKDEPRPMTALQPVSPPILDRVVRKCLAKDADRRWQTVQDLHDELQWIAEGGASETQVSTAVASDAAGERPSWSLLLGAVLGVGVLAGLVGWGVARPEQIVQQATRFEVSVTSADRLDTGSVAISPDGRTLVYVTLRDSRQQLVRRAMGEFEAIPIPGTEDGNRPFFSPDGRWIGFFAGGELKKVQLDGGPAITLGLVSGFGHVGSWGADGTILYTVGGGTPGVSRISAEGGTPESLTVPDAGAGDRLHGQPAWLPSSTAFVFTSWADVPPTPEGGRVEVFSLTTGERRILTSGFSPQYSSSGHLLFARSDGLWAAPFDATDLVLAGDPRPVVEEVLVSPFGLATYATARDGSLVYVPRGTGGSATRLVWVDRAGRPTPLLDTDDHFAFPRLSSDGVRVAVAIGEDGPFTGLGDIWLYEVERGGRTRLTFNRDVANRFFPTWTPDGSRIVHQAGGELFWSRTDGTGQSEPLLIRNAGPTYPFSFAPDGQTLAFYENHPATGRDIWMLPMAGDQTPQPFLVTPFEERSPLFSPDGRWLAYVSDETGAVEVYVTPYPGADRKIPVSTGGGTEPMWARDGRELFYRTADELMVVTFDSVTGRAGTPTALFTDGFVRDESAGAVSANYDISLDGERFVMVDRVQALATQQSIRVVLDWSEELTERVPVP